MAIDPFPEPRAGAQTPTLRKQHSRGFPMAVRQEADSSTEWSGEHLIPSNGYSSLFTTGLMRQASPSGHVPFPVAYPSTLSLSSQSQRPSSTSSSQSGRGHDHASTVSGDSARASERNYATHLSPSKQSPKKKSSPNKYKPTQHRVHSPAKRSPNKSRTCYPASGVVAPNSPRKRSTASPRKGTQYSTGGTSAEAGQRGSARGGGGTEKAERALESGMSKLRLAQYTISPFKSRFSAGPRAADSSPYNNPYGAGTSCATSGKKQNKAYASPSKNQSRWSLSSDDSESEFGSSGHRRSTSQSTQQDKDSLWGLGLPRKSGESSRSKMSKMSKMSKASKASRAGGGGSGSGFGLGGAGGFTPSGGMASSGSSVFGNGGAGGGKAIKKSTSLWSLRSRKSEDHERFPIHGNGAGQGCREGFMRDETGEIVPVLPPMPDPEALAQVEKERQAALARAQLHQQNGQMPQTPGRGRRVVEGLARRLGLTPKKKREKDAPKTPKTPKGRKSTAPSEFTLDDSEGHRSGSPFAFNVPAHALGQMPVPMMPRQRLGSTVTTMTTHTSRSHTSQADHGVVPPRVPFAEMGLNGGTSVRDSNGSGKGSANGPSTEVQQNPHHSAFSFETPRRPASPFAALARPASPCASALSNGSPRELPSANLGLAGSPHTPTNRLYGTAAAPTANGTPTATAAGAVAAAETAGTDSPTSFIPRMGPKKSSLTTLRSIARKTSTGTLRSVRSFYGIGTSSTPGVDAFSTDGDAPPIPRSTSNNGYGGGWDADDVPASCVPITPRRAPKSSIGPPKAQARVSPSAFDAPRRAPKTPDSAVKGAGGGYERSGAVSRAGAGSQMRNYADMPVYSAITSSAEVIVTANTSQMSNYSQQSVSMSSALRSMDANQIASIRDMRTAGKDGRVTPWGERAKERMGMGPGENELRREVLVASPKQGGEEVDMDAFADADEDASPIRVNRGSPDGPVKRVPRGASARTSTSSSARKRAQKADADTDSENDNDMDVDGEDDLDDVITFQSYIRASVATASTTTSPRSADVSMRSMLAQIVEGDGSPSDRSDSVGPAAAAGSKNEPRPESAMSQHGPLHVQKRKAVPAVDDATEGVKNVEVNEHGKVQAQEQEMAPRSKTPIFERFARGTTPDLSGGMAAEPGTHNTPVGDSTCKSDLTPHQLITPRHANVAGRADAGRCAPSAFAYKPHNTHKPSVSAASAFSVSQMTEPSFDSHHLRTSTPNSQHLDSPDSLRSTGTVMGDNVLPARSRSQAGQYVRNDSPVFQNGRIPAPERAQTPSPISAANAVATAGFPLTAKQAQAAASAGVDVDGDRERGSGANSTTPKPRRLMDILSTPGKKGKSKTGGIPLRIRPRDGAGKLDAERMPLQPLRGVGNVPPGPAPISATETKTTYSPIASIWGNKIPSPDKASAFPYRSGVSRSPMHDIRMGKENDDENRAPYSRSTTAMGYNDDRDKQHRYHHHPSRPARPARPSSPSPASPVEPYARPATSMTHRQHRDYTFSPYDPAPMVHASAQNQYQPAHRPIVDFSRRMSDQRAFGVGGGSMGPLTASGSGPGDSSFDIATRALDKLRAEQAAADAAAFDMGSAGGETKGMRGGSPIHHGRQASGGSMRTEESSFTAMTAGTGVTGVTTTSREGEWELERYLR